MYAHRRGSSGAKGNHLAETAGVWESAAIRQTSLAPADYLKARPPPGHLRPPLPPTISFPKSVARIIKLVEERRERDRKGDRRKKRLLSSCHPTLSDERPVLPYSATYMLSTSIYRCSPWSSPYLPTLFLFFGPSACLLLLLLPARCSLPILHDAFFVLTEKFSRRRTDRGRASFEFRPRVYEWHGSENLFSISATPTGSRSIRVMYRVISK